MKPEYEQRLENAKTAARALRCTATERKNAVLLQVAHVVRMRRQKILEANAQDLQALGADATSAFRDRLTLNNERIEHMVKSLEEIAALPDPIDEVAETKNLSNGLVARRMRAPLGVIFMIFESRPNVALEAFSLAFKSGNVVLLRGGKESRSTVAALYALLEEVLVSQSLPKECFWGILDSDRELVAELLTRRDTIDVVIPRGGDGLIQFVTENSRIPIIKNDRGMCHVYIHEDADQKMAVEIIENAKTQRPGVCNSMETVLVHASVARQILPLLHAQLAQAPEKYTVQWYGCKKTCEILDGQKNVFPATNESWGTEYLDYKMNCKVVDSLDAAIEHIEKFGSKHSEAIVTGGEISAKKFQTQVDAAVTYWNASTRFTDGFELGLGGEIGISTQKLHVRGPVGLRELTSLRWVIDGSGQVRQK